MAISLEILNRKGALKQALLTDQIKDLLNQGLIASVNLTEWLAVDHCLLVKNTLPEQYHQVCLTAIDSLKEKTAMKSIPVVGKALLESGVNRKTKLFKTLSDHVSDSVRCWAAYIIGIESAGISVKLEAIKPLAADKNFGVREIAWMATRADVIDNLEEAIGILSGWTGDADVNVRRFAVESTRPRGVWTKHIDKLKENPELGLPLLEPLKTDSEKYVRDSVANWLNDASKTQPEFVKNTCDRWSKESKTKETTYIVKRALRSINK